MFRTAYLSLGLAVVCGLAGLPVLAGVFALAAVGNAAGGLIARLG